MHVPRAEGGICSVLDWQNLLSTFQRMVWSNNFAFRKFRQQTATQYNSRVIEHLIRWRRADGSIAFHVWRYEDTNGWIKMVNELPYSVLKRTTMNGLIICNFFKVSFTRKPDRAVNLNLGRCFITSPTNNKFQISFYCVWYSYPKHSLEIAASLSAS